MTDKPIIDRMICHPDGSLTIHEDVLFAPKEPYAGVFLTKTQIEILINLLRQEVLHMVTVTVPESEIEPLRDLNMALEMVSSEMGE